MHVYVRVCVRTYMSAHQVTVCQHTTTRTAVRKEIHVPAPHNTTCMRKLAATQPPLPPPLPCPHLLKAVKCLDALQELLEAAHQVREAADDVLGVCVGGGGGRVRRVKGGEGKRVDRSGNQPMMPLGGGWHRRVCLCVQMRREMGEEN